MKIMVTGYAGFIGSNFVKQLVKNKDVTQVIGVDCFTYAARPNYIHNFLEESGLGYKFTKVYQDLSDDYKLVDMIHFMRPDVIFHLAAETHVCNSIKGPRDFLNSNVVATFNLLEAFRKVYGSNSKEVFHHVSTDEVYGELGLSDPAFTEKTPYNPRSPYAATKASSDMLVKSYAETYGLNTRITNCTNNFGPNQHEEKLVPRTIKHVLENKPIVIHGKGDHVRDWIHVDDHCEALWTVFKEGRPGEQYAIGGNMELANLTMIKEIIEAMDELEAKRPVQFIHTDDRPTDDFRYAVDTTKVETLGWKPKPELFEQRLKETCTWYLSQ